MMERIGLFVDRSALVRWGQTPQRSFVPRAKQVWHKASTFSIGPDFTAILADDDDADAAAFSFENPCQCDPYISGPVLKVEHYDCIKQPIEKTEESLSVEIRSALTSSILTDLDDDDRDEGYQRPMTRMVPIVPVVYRQPVATVVRPTIPLPPLVLGDSRQLAPAPVNPALEAIIAGWQMRIEENAKRDDGRAPEPSSSNDAAGLEAAKGRGFVGTTLSKAAPASSEER